MAPSFPSLRWPCVIAFAVRPKSWIGPAEEAATVADALFRMCHRLLSWHSDQRSPTTTTTTWSKWDNRLIRSYCIGILLWLRLAFHFCASINDSVKLDERVVLLNKGYKIYSLWDMRCRWLSNWNRWQNRRIDASGKVPFVFDGNAFYESLNNDRYQQCLRERLIRPNRW